MKPVAVAVAILRRDDGRELSEELGIRILDARLYLQMTTAHSDLQSYDLSYFFVESWRGELRNIVFNDIRWVYPVEFAGFDILEGNHEICRRLSNEP